MKEDIGETLDGLAELAMTLPSNWPLWVAVNRKTGEVGHLARCNGYLLGGHYVNPAWNLVVDLREEQ